jgi:formylglycine-generating enzyme required for sulfatase activity
MFASAEMRPMGRLGSDSKGNAARRRPGAALPATLSNAIGMKLKLVPAGTFLMGSPPEEEHHSSDEGPRHSVHIKRSFYLGVYPVTQSEYEVVTGLRPARRSGGPEHPVCGVSWEEAMRFCALLSDLSVEKRARRCYQLPSEAEWEYACRAGTTTAFAFGDNLSSTAANFDGRFPYGAATWGPFVRGTTRVGSYPPNGWGLHDMHGNVWEWCNGYYYDDEHYRTAPHREGDDKIGGKPADPRVIRGGCWNSKAWKCRSADRYRITGTTSTRTIGFRVLVRVVSLRRGLEQAADGT